MVIAEFLEPNCYSLELITNYVVLLNIFLVNIFFANYY